MDRRRLILASGALIPAAALSRVASAQTQLPPARPAPQDGPPPTSEEYPASPYHAPTYRAPAYSASGYGNDPAYNNGGQDDRYADQPSAPPPRRADDDRYRDDRYRDDGRPAYANAEHADTYSREELVNSVSDFLGVTAEAAGSAIERIFRDNGRPTGYVAGEEVAAAFTIGLRYGKGLLYMKSRQPKQVFWQGPSVGFDIRANGSRVFTLCYNLQYPDAIYRRFPGVEGSAYLIGGMGVNYQRAEDIVLAPMRAGVGLGAGVNLGYLAYSRHRNWIPL